MKKFFVYFTLFLVVVLVGFIIYTNVVKTGLTLREHSEYLEYAFYGVSGILCYILILRPIIVITMMPHYSVAQYCDEDLSNNSGLRKRAKRVYKYGRLDDESKKDVLDALKSNKKEILSQRMYIVYNNQMKKNIDKIVQDCSRDILYLTAISQHHFADMIMVLTNNFRMIKKIVIMLGFRPTFLRLAKIYINVFLTSIIADGAQRLEITSLFNSSIKGGLKLIADSAANGAINAFNTLRIGMLAKQYLYASNVKKEKIKIRNFAISEAAKMFPGVIASLLTSPIKGVTSLFNKKEVKSTEDVDAILDEIPDEIDWNWKNK